MKWNRHCNKWLACYLKWIILVISKLLVITDGRRFCNQGLLSLYMVGWACTQWKIGGGDIFLVLIFFSPMFHLYPVQYKFIANFYCGGNINSHIVHFDIGLCTAFCPKCFLMTAGGLGRGGDDPKFDSILGGIEATVCNIKETDNHHSCWQSFQFRFNSSAEIVCNQLNFNRIILV